VFPFLEGSSYLEPHAFLINYFPGPWAPGGPEFIPCLVIPISVAVDSGARRVLMDPYDHNQRRRKGASELAQIGVDDGTTSSWSTEWVRYNAIVAQGPENHLVRASKFAFNRVVDYLAETHPLLQAAQNWNDRIFQIGFEVGQGTYATGAPAYQELLADLNREDPYSPADNRLAFRGALQTASVAHAAAEGVRPVFRVWRDAVEWGQVRPGRFDEVTLLEAAGGANRTSDSHTINYGWSTGPVEDWGSQVSHVALMTDLDREIEVPERRRYDVDPEDPAPELIARFKELFETREADRMVKFPSGELPAGDPGRLFLGREKGAEGGPPGALIDEVRLWSYEDPDPDLSTAEVVLEERLARGEENAIDLHEDAFCTSRGVFRDPFLEAFLPVEEFPEDAFYVLIGDEVIACKGRDISGARNLTLVEGGRGALGTEAGAHEAGEPLTLLPWLVVSKLRGAISESEAEVRVDDVTGFPRSGFVVIDDEVLGYTSVTGSGKGGALQVPRYLQPERTDSEDRPAGAFRGRYGTLPEYHEQETLVLWLPHRYPDWYAPEADFPELGCFEVTVPARRAWFDRFTWREENDGNEALASLVAQVRILGRGDFSGDPEEDPDLFFFDKPTEDGTAHLLGRQGDLLEARFFVRYLQGALDPVDMNSNGWKRAPTLELVGVEYLGETVVERHEEHR
jgi:hypothetical protein